MNAVALDLRSLWGSSVPDERARKQPAAGGELPARLRRWLLTESSSLQAPPLSMQAQPLETGSASAVEPLDWAEVRAAVGGDGEAYARLVRRYQQPIAAYMWRFTRDRGQWEELVHDVFVEAYLSLSRFAGRAPLLHWLKRIATRVGYRHWQTRQRLQRELPLPADTDPGAATQAESEAARHAGEVVHLVLQRLAPRDRLVMTLIYLEGCSVGQVAELTGWTQTLVKVQAHRARKRLARICEQLGIER